jgi:PKD repeat protein
MKQSLKVQFSNRFLIFILLTGLMALLSRGIYAQTYKYADSWGEAGFTVKDQMISKVIVSYSIHEFSLTDIDIKGEQMKNLELPGHFLPNNEGAPNLPGSGRYLAIPQGATATVNILSYRTETLNNITIAPAPRIPWETETGPLEYNKDMSVYSVNEFFPEEPVKISDPDLIRGIDVAMLGVTPFHYNPVTKQLVIFRDIEMEVTFNGGNGHFGEDRLRSRWWDPMLSDMLLNYKSLPKINYNKSSQGTDETGCEYLIITPNGAEFVQWADSIKKFRMQQGILTDVVTISEIGANTVTSIENYVNNAFNSWDIVPAACLLLGDYGTSGNTIVAPIWNSYCVSDNIYSDVNNNNLPDIVFARITAQNASQLQVMITKFLNYERTPPTSAYFYEHPITALGWQTERWFQICTEVIGGYWREVQGKDPIRINAIYSGTPGNIWSTATNTTTVVNYFGPNGLGYIPQSPATLGGWSGGTAAMVNAAINSGAFMLQHRDHGYEQGWGEPAYSSSHISSLTNTNLTFVWSVNCLTGKYNYNSEVFSEKFHRYTYNGQNSGALGINAASEVSYSFVNDTYVWGAYDNMWPDFMPAYGSTPEPRGVLPAFASAAGKYFLQASSWPYNTENKVVTYNLFHHHGDAFSTVYSEVPQNLTVVHNPILYAGVTSFDVTADADALIALTVNDEIIGTATGTGSPVTITIPGQVPPDQVLVTVTKQNYYRYQSLVEVIPPSGPYIVQTAVSLNDISGNNNGIMETSETILAGISVENVGVETADNVTVTISSTDEFVSITDNYEAYGSIAAGETVTIPDGFTWVVADNIPDQHIVSFELSATDGFQTWITYYTLTGFAPLLEAGSITIVDSDGNNNGRLDPGETADIHIETFNNGSFVAIATTGLLSTSSGYITLNNTAFDFGSIEAGTMEEAVFSISVSPDAPVGTAVVFTFYINSGGYAVEHEYAVTIGLIVEDWETGNMSQFDWQTGGNSNWAVSTQNPYEGTYCIKSGSLGDNQSNWLSLTYDVLTADSVSFWYKVSSESSYDFLRFYIDNTELAAWSGEAGWARIAFAVTTGSHTFKWEYDKDYSVAGGSDCSWVDFIVFPAAVFDASFTASATDICEGESVNFYDSSSGNAISWEWTFEGGTPATSTLQNPVVMYEIAGTYDVSLTVSDGVEVSTATLQDYITVSTIPGTANTPAGITLVCANSGTTTYTTTALPGITEYDWVLEPVGAGTITSTTASATVYWSTGFLGDATLKVAGVNDCGTGNYSDVLNITRYLPAVTLAPFEMVCLAWPAFELTGGMPEGGVYSGPGVIDGWFNPATAGLGTHTITYTFEDVNGCENSASETILVDPCTGISDNTGTTGLTIFPNPNSGTFRLEVTLQGTEKYSLKIYNTLNEVIWADQIKMSGGIFSDEINMTGHPDGIYYLHLTGENKSEVRKIIIHR